MVQEEGKTQLALEGKTATEIMKIYGVGRNQARLMLVKRDYPEKKVLIQALARKAQEEYQNKLHELLEDRFSHLLNNEQEIEIKDEDKWEESIIEGKLKYRGELYEK